MAAVASTRGLRPALESTRESTRAPMCESPPDRMIAAMTTTDYLLDSALVLLVLLQIKERPMTTRLLVRPLVILGVAVASYFHSIPTSGNDLR